VLAEITAGQGSTPRTSGALMAVLANGDILGTIGGGIVEARVIESARKVFESREPLVLSFQLDKGLADTLDMICGGNLTISLQYIAPDSKGFAVIERLKERQLGLRKRVMLIGAGHVSQKTAQLTGYTGFETWVMDDRIEFANRKRFRNAERIIVLKSFEGMFTDLTVDPNTFIVILTRGHAYDKTVLEQAIQTRAGYIGMIGSRKKKEAIFDALLRQGFKKEDLDRVRAPVGLAIGAQTPEEIAVSIVGQLIQVRAGAVS
jgi:xanthine dehydrogenase accessory factor